MRYRELAHRVDEALGFVGAAGLTVDHPIMTTTDFWTSHECLLLPYEQALTREDSTSGLYYDCSSHMLWVGGRTRQLDGVHVEFLRGVANPLGIKASDKMDPNELVKLIKILNPRNKPGRITVITRMGAENMRVKLPHLIRAVGEVGQIVTWVSDPMHGNTIKAPCGLKTRPFDAIRFLHRSELDCTDLDSLCIKDQTLTNESIDKIVGFALSHHLKNNSSNITSEDAKIVLSCESIKHGFDILQSSQSDVKSSKKSLKDVVTENDFEKRL